MTPTLSSILSSLCLLLLSVSSFAQPKLTINSKNFPTAFEAGKATTLSLDIGNFGNEAVNGYVITLNFAGYSFEVVRSNEALSPNTLKTITPTFTLPISIPSGTYSGSVFIRDPNNNYRGYMLKPITIMESSSNSNLPDINFTNLPSFSGTYRALETLPSFDIGFQNTDRENTTRLYLQFYLSKDNKISADDQKIQERDIGLLRSPNTISVNNLILPKLESGSYFILVELDSRKAIAEQNENNNVAALPIYVQGAPQLVIKNVTGPTNVKPGATFTLNVTVKNEGTAAYYGGEQLFLYQYANPSCFKGPCGLFLSKLTSGYTIPAIALNQTKTFTVTWTMPQAFHKGKLTREPIEPSAADTYVGLSTTKFTVFYDKNSIIDAYPFNIEPILNKSDVAITVQSNQTTIGPDNKLKVSVFVKNNGPETARYINIGMSINNYPQVPDFLPKEVGKTAGSFSIYTFYGNYISNWYITSIAPNTTARLDLEYTLNSITYPNFESPLDVTEFRASYTLGQIVNDFTGNNQATLSFNLDTNNDNLPDLILSNLRPEPGKVGAVTKYKVNIQNIGAIPASNDYVIGCWLSKDNSLSSNDTYVGFINTGNTHVTTIQDVPGSIRIPSNFLIGDYYLILQIDKDNVIAERNESNNIIAAPITIFNDASNTYCTSYGKAPWEEWIAEVRLGSLQHTSNKDVTTIDGKKTYGYGDYTHLGTNLEIGANQTIQLKPGKSWAGHAANLTWSVWIDLNKNKLFDSNELLFTKSGANDAISGTFKVPTSATTGSTRMRIAAKKGTAATACEVFDKGEVQDYTVNITSVGGRSSVTSYLAEDFQIFPNPAEYQATIDLSMLLGEEVQLSIVNQYGQILQQYHVTEVTAPTIELPIEQLRTGMYQVLIQTPNRRATSQRLVVVKEN